MMHALPATSHIYALSQNTQPANTQLSISHSQTNGHSQRPAQQPSAWGYLFSRINGEYHSLTAPIVTVGRSDNCSIAIADEKISGVHCVIHRELAPDEDNLFQFGTAASASPRDTLASPDDVADESATRRASPYVYFVEDRSMNGTFIDGIKIGKGKRRQIYEGAVISLVAVSAKRSRVATVMAAAAVGSNGLCPAAPPPAAAVDAGKVTKYVATFDFNLIPDKDRAAHRAYTASEVSTGTAVATPSSSVAFPAEPVTSRPVPFSLAPATTSLLPSQPASATRRGGQHLFSRGSSVGGGGAPSPHARFSSQRHPSGLFGGKRHHSSTSAAALGRPKTLSWQWGQCVGSGSFAEVYIGIDTETARMIAIKRMKATIEGAQPSVSALNDGYSATLDDWGVDPSDMFDPNNPSQGAPSPNAKGNNNGKNCGGPPPLDPRLVEGGPMAPRSDDDEADSADGTRVVSTGGRRLHSSDTFLFSSDSSGSPTTLTILGNRHTAIASAASPKGSGGNCQRNGQSPTDPTATTLPMVSKAVLVRENTRVDEFQGLSAEQHAEVELLKSLSHRSVVHYYGFAVVDSHLCILLEFVAGGSLVSLLRKFGAFQESVVRIYTTQALQGLEYLHDNGVVHGDIKPGNFLVTDAGVVKLSDFGTGRIVSSTAKAARDRRNKNNKKKDGDGEGCSAGLLLREETLSPTTQLMGTPAFMSPEMVRGNKSTFSSDVWALGCTVMELFTGRAPWFELGLSTNPYGLLYQIGTRETPPSFQYVVEKNASQALISFLGWCFVKAPEERPTAADLLTHPFIAQDSKVCPTMWRPASFGEGSGAGPSVASLHTQPTPTPPLSLANGGVGGASQGYSQGAVSSVDATPFRTSTDGGGQQHHPAALFPSQPNGDAGLVATPRQLGSTLAAAGGGENSSNAVPLPPSSSSRLLPRILANASPADRHSLLYGGGGGSGQLLAASTPSGSAKANGSPALGGRSMSHPLLTPMSQLQQQYIASMSGGNNSSQQQHQPQQVMSREDTLEARALRERQRTETGELIGQHYEYLHSLAKTVLKKVPTAILSAEAESAAPPSTASTAVPPPEAETDDNATSDQFAREVAANVRPLRSAAGAAAASSPTGASSEGIRQGDSFSVLPASGRAGRISSAGLGAAVTVAVPFPSLPDNLFMPSSPVEANSSSAVLAAFGGDEQRVVAASSIAEGRAGDHEAVDGGAHTGLTTKLRRIELDAAKDYLD